MYLRRPLITITLLLAGSLAAETHFPRPDWHDAPDPLADPAARVGGSISSFAGQYPESFNYYLANNTFSAELFALMYETLLDLDPLSMEYRPALADHWTLSDDKRSFTFHLDPNATWSDGTRITAEDVRWTYDTIMAPEHTTGPHKVSLARFQPPKVLDTRTIRFTAKEVHWQNLGAAAGFHILPKHQFKDRDFNTLNFDFPIVSGPYHITDIDEGIAVTLSRRDDWWQRHASRNRHKGNFTSLIFRFYAQRENAFEAFKKGLIDIYPVHTARLWVKETRGANVLNNWIVKQKIQNYRPVGFQGFAMNMRRPPFNDLRVRKAMAHLLNRERMNRTLMYNQYFLHRSYYEDLYGPDTPCTNPVFDYDPTAAADLLAQAGWHANPDTGILEKNGLPLTFTFLTRSATSDKFLQIYNEDLKNAGIDMKIKRKDWAAWSKDMSEFNFEMTWAAWGAGLFKNPESMWHSDEAVRTSGNNITGFQDPHVDACIEKQKTIFNVHKRHAICREIDAIVTRKCPYVLLWNLNYTRLLYWNKFGVPPTVLSKHGDANAALWYWWYDQDAATALKDARDLNLPLPPPAPIITFNETFTP